MSDLHKAIYGESPVIYEEVDNYSPTRLEYFAGKALQGLVTGRADKNIGRAVTVAIDLALEMEEQLDGLDSKKGR